MDYAGCVSTRIGAGRADGTRFNGMAMHWAEQTRFKSTPNASNIFLISISIS